MRPSVKRIGESLDSLLPTAEQVRTLLTETGALRVGHFVLPSGAHTEHFLQTQRVLRLYRNARILSVALTRRLRQVPSVRPHLPNVAICTTTNSGIPVAFGVREALDAERVLWTECVGTELDLDRFEDVQPKQKFILVVDVVRDGYFLEVLCDDLARRRAQVLTIGCLVDLRVSRESIGGHHVHSLVHIPTQSYSAEECPLDDLYEGEPETIKWL